LAFGTLVARPIFLLPVLPFYLDFSKGIFYTIYMVKGGETMNKRAILTMVAFTFLVLLFPGFAHGVIPASERGALIALYNSTNGDSWTNKTGWKTPPLHTDGFAMPGTEGGWYGVTVSKDHVDTIIFYDNNLSGSIPSQLGNMSNLEWLNLGNNQLSGSIPSQLGDLSNLYSLWLANNQLSGSIPSQLGDLSDLYSLGLASNQLSGSIPSQLGNLSQLGVLFLYSNQLSGSIPSQLGNLSNLKYLYLDNNQLSGSIPSQLGNLSKLQDLWLGHNQLSGSIPPQLGNLSNLEELRLEANQLSGSIPSKLGDLTQLQWLWLSGNQLLGSIPSQLGNLSNLESLLLNYNQLSGSIPSQLVNLSNLEELRLEANQLSGSIPSQLGNLSNLGLLHMNDNQLSGSIPSQLGSLNNLWSLDLNDNQLSGSIPAQLGNLSNLTQLILSYNKLSGVIPSSFINLPKMIDLRIRYNCLSATDPELRAWLDSHDPDWEANQNQCTPGITLNRTDLYFGSDGQSSTAAQTVLIGNNSGGTLNWSAAGNVSWLSLNPSSGIGDSILAVSVNPAGLAAGTYPGTIAISDPNAINSPKAIFVQLQVYNPGTTSGPFGDFATPVEGSSTYSSVPVTGWALDDIGVASVKIYNGDVYVGDAVFVEGARPDVQAAYPTYPNNYKAGWGYMLLTNFLPGGGNGTYTLIAKATDMEGNEVTLGTKTINIDNAHAVKPFGAIDTPGQGGTASGSAFRNWGWALTPQPNQIPTDGTTIAVWVDGVNLGHPTYNIYRPDVASLFPGLANSNGSAGYFDFNTTCYSNGLHTISWTATDSGGNTDGIGSRYFTIQNTGNAREQSTVAENGTTPGAGIIDIIPTRYSEPLKFSKGFSADAGWEESLPDENGMCLVVIKELERVEIHLGDSPAGIQGFLLNDTQLNRLPIGSTVDAKAGTFSWCPGPGFVGRYSLVFVLTDTNGDTFKKFIDIKIVPKFNGIR
jgi:Leucine-rich repeat (LRR) protein